MNYVDVPNAKELQSAAGLQNEEEESLLDGLSCTELFQTTEGLTYK